jgi:hypothetical protein
VHGRVEPPGAVFEPERGEDALRERSLTVGGEGLREEGGVDRRRFANELGQHRPDRAEDFRDLDCRHGRFEVVEERRVRRVGPLEALCVAALEVEVPLERGEEPCEVACLSRLDPKFVAERRVHHLRLELGRYLPLLLPVAARDPDEARVVGVIVEGLLERAKPVEKAPQLVVHETLVVDPTERRERLGAGGVPSGRHRHLLIPVQEPERAVEIRDLGDALLERTEIRVHRGAPYRPTK